MEVAEATSVSRMVEVESISDIEQHSCDEPANNVVGNAIPSDRQEDHGYMNHCSNQSQPRRPRGNTYSKTKTMQLMGIFLAIAGLAIGASLVVLFYLQRKEQDEFRRAFETLALALVDGFHENALLRVQIMRAFSISLTSTAASLNATWPFVTIPDFEARATAVRVTCNSDFVELYPYVTEQDRPAWEAYTQDPVNLKWLNESYAYQAYFYQSLQRPVGPRAVDVHSMAETAAATDGVDPSTRRTTETETYEIVDDDMVTTSDFIPNDDDSIQQLPSRPKNATFDGVGGTCPNLYRYPTDEEYEEGYQYVVEDGPGPYYPMWQQSPASARANRDANYNVYDEYFPSPWSQALEVVRLNKTAVFGAVWNVDEVGAILEDDDYDTRMVPAATLFYPIFEHVIPPAVSDGDKDNQNKSGSSEGDNNVVSVIGLDMEFGPLFSSVLWPGSKPIGCVISNPCGQTFSYLVTGDTSLYLGPEDLHNTKYDSVRHEAYLTGFEDDLFTRDVHKHSKYNGAPINHDFCPWKLSIYATDELSAQYITNQPLAYMSAVLVLIVMTCLIFILYDFFDAKNKRRSRSSQ